MLPTSAWQEIVKAAVAVSLKVTPIVCGFELVTVQLLATVEAVSCTEWLVPADRPVNTWLPLLETACGVPPSTLIV